MSQAPAADLRTKSQIAFEEAQKRQVLLHLHLHEFEFIVGVGFMPYHRAFCFGR